MKHELCIDFRNLQCIAIILYVQEVLIHLCSISYIKWFNNCCVFNTFLSSGVEDKLNLADLFEHIAYFSLADKIKKKNMVKSEHGLTIENLVH